MKSATPLSRLSVCLILALGAAIAVRANLDARQAPGQFQADQQQKHWRGQHNHLKWRHARIVTQATQPFLMRKRIVLTRCGVTHERIGQSRATPP